MGLKARPQYFYVWLHHRITTLDDSLLKVRAFTSQEARRVAKRSVPPSQFRVGVARTSYEMRKFDPTWINLQAGKPGANER